ELDPDLVAYNLMTLDERLTLGLIVNRTAATVSGILGLLALALGSLGLYGTMSFLVQLRRREIGVRLAVGRHRSSAWTRPRVDRGVRSQPLPVRRHDGRSARVRACPARARRRRVL